MATNDTTTSSKQHQHSTHLKPVAVVLRCQTKILQHLRDRFFFDAVQVFRPCSKSQITPVTNGTIVICPYIDQSNRPFPQDIFKMLTFSVFNAFFGVNVLFICKIRQNYTDLRCLLDITVFTQQAGNPPPPPHIYILSILSIMIQEDLKQVKLLAFDSRSTLFNKTRQYNILVFDKMFSFKYRTRQIKTTKTHMKVTYLNSKQ